MLQEYIDAGYHLQTSGDHPQPFKTPGKHSLLLGVYDTPEGELVIEFLPEGPSTLPELKLSFENGRILTVACEDTVREYLRMYEAARANRKQRHTPGRVVLDHWEG